MKTLLAAMLLLGPALATAQVETAPSAPPPQYLPPQAPQTVAPPSPQEIPPAPQLAEPPQSYSYDVAPPDEVAQPPAVAAPDASGQWVFTGQYGWVWRPYGAGYTYLPAGGAYPDMYVYWPSYGWRWVVAPWVWGVGPRPFFGRFGFAHYAWYGRGFGHWYGYRGVAPSWVGRGYAHPVYAHPVAPGRIVGPRPGGVTVRVHPGAYVRPGGFARPAPIARPSGGYVGAHVGGVAHSGGFGRR
jgi:hypothetical protein